MAQTGADPAQLDELGRQLSTWAEHLSATRPRIELAMTAAAWHGHDATVFRARWRTELSPGLGRMSTSLDDLARAVVRQAEEQRKASRPGGGGANPSAGPHGPYPDDDRQPSPPVDPFPGSEVDVDELTAVQRLELAETYAPTLEFQTTERYQLGDPEDFLDHSELIRVEDKNNWWDDVDTMIDRGDVDGYDLQGLDGDHDWHLDLADEDGPREAGYDSAKMLYEIHESDEHGPQVTYWLFYPYNDGPGPQNHEGDWERVSVDLDDAYRPDGVAFSGHGTPTWREWEDVQLDDDRPVVYVAQGTHANYPEAGEWDTDAPGPIDESAEGGDPVDLLDMTPVDVSGEDCYGSDVFWGERGETDHTSGPTGPGAKGALRDHDDLDDDEPNEPWYAPFRSFGRTPYR